MGGNGAINLPKGHYWQIVSTVKGELQTVFTFLYLTAINFGYTTDGSFIVDYTQSYHVTPTSEIGIGRVGQLHPTGIYTISEGRADVLTFGGGFRVAGPTEHF